NFNNKYILKEINKYFDENKLKKYLENSKLNGELNDLSKSALKIINEAKSKSFSVSRLDKFKNYPYEYFINYILKYYQKDDYDEQIEMNELGTIHHNIISTIYSEFAEIIKLNKNYSFYLKSINNNLSDIIPVNIKL